jgi:polyphosphate kinase
MKPENLINRELSWLEFNYRVLEEALDKGKPCFERLKFLAIFSDNLDEFLMVRVANLISMVKKKIPLNDPAGYSAEGLLEEIKERLSRLFRIQYKCFNSEILKDLSVNGYEFYTAETIPKKFIKLLKSIFLKKFYLILTPMAIDQARPFPFLAGKSLNILVNLRNPGKQDNLYAVIPVPQSERLIKIPDKTNKKFIYSEELIKLFTDQIFKGYEIIKTCTFRIIRDAELSIDEEEATDLLMEIENQLKKREKGAPIRLEIEKTARAYLVEY